MNRTLQSLLRVMLRNLGIVLLAMIVAVLARKLLLGELGTRIVWVTFYPAVVIASLYGGWLTGVLSAVAACLIALYGWPLLVDQPYIKDYGDRLGMLAFLFNCAMISAVAEVARRARQRAIKARDLAEAAIHDMKQAEESLRLFESAVEQSNESIVITDAELDLPGPRIVFVNPAYTRLTGFTAKEVMGKSPRIAQGRHTDKTVLRRLRANLERGEVFRGELINYRKDRSEYDLELQIAPLRNAGGKITHFVAIQCDITERRRTEQTLRESEAHFRFLNDLAEATRTQSDSEQIMAITSRMLGEHLRASRCAYADVEKDGNQFNILHDYTDGCASTVGNYQLALFGARAVAQLHAGQPLIIRNVEAELLPGEGAGMFNAIGIKAIITCPLVKEGALRAMMAVHQTTSRDWKAGEVALVQEVVERSWATIERRSAVEKLRQSEALLRIAGRTARLGGWAVDLPDGHITWSDEVCAILEVPPGTVPGPEQALGYYASPSRETVSQALAACIQQGTPFDLELEVITAKRHDLWVRCTGEARRNAAGVITRAQGAFQDITARRKAERQLEQAHTQLLALSRQAGMAEFATGILHNVGNVLNSVNVASTCVADSLRRSKAANLAKVVTLLREHEQDLGDFFTRNPKGRLVPEFLAQLAGQLAGEQAGALKELAELQKNSEHIKEIVTSQQGMAKSSSAGNAVNVSELVEDAVRMNSTGVARHKIDVIKECADLPTVMVEKSRALQILVNLVRNAKQACAASGNPEKKLTIRTTAGIGHVRIAVTDNGVGIPPENLARIFSHGFTTKQDGHGFGLNSAALAAKDMGGALSVQSDGPGHGATFILELPLAPDTPAHEDSVR